MYRSVAPRLLWLPLLLAACDAPPKGGEGTIACGMATLTGPLMAKEAFAKGNSLTTLPDTMPATLPLRVVAGPAMRGGVTADTGGGWRITAAGTVPAGSAPGYGVLVVDGRGHPFGALIFDGVAIPGAAELGVVVFPDTIVPLLGVRMDPKALEVANCPAIFPDSLR